MNGVDIEAGQTSNECWLLNEEAAERKPEMVISGFGYLSDEFWAVKPALVGNGLMACLNI